MAQVKKIAWDVIPLNERVKIGHNRTIYKPQADLLYCSLHDHTVAIFRKAVDGGFDVTLDHCGWMTTTTMRAIKDFLGFAGISAGVSRAKGKFTARYKVKRDLWLDQAADDSGQRIYFNAPYIDPRSHGVIIGGVYPPILAILAQGPHMAQKAAEHMRDMFPHIKDKIGVDELPEGLPLRYTPASGFIKDGAQAYCVAWRGRGVALWEGLSPCGKAS